MDRITVILDDDVRRDEKASAKVISDLKKKGMVADENQALRRLGMLNAECKSGSAKILEAVKGVKRIQLSGSKHIQ